MTWLVMSTHVYIDISSSFQVLQVWHLSAWRHTTVKIHAAIATRNL